MNTGKGLAELDQQSLEYELVPATTIHRWHSVIICILQESAARESIANWYSLPKPFASCGSRIGHVPWICV
nr:hypothetical protein [Paenibacillus bovis]